VALDPRTPVIVGVGQVVDREAPADAVPSPAQLIARAAEAAAADSGAGRALLEAATSLRIVDVLSWRYADVAAAVAGHLGVAPPEQLRSPTGGNSPQVLLDDACERILSGAHDVVVIGGGEVVHGRARARKAGVEVAWEHEPEGTRPAVVLGQDKNGFSDAEAAAGLFLPVVMYPMLEQAVRAHAGRSGVEHLAEIGGLWSRFSEVAAANPRAWSPQARTAAEITTPTPANRAVAWPYTKLMVANIQVDMAAAVVVTSVEAARRLGVAEDRWVFPLAGAEANDTWFVSERKDLWRSPALEAIGRALADATGTAPADAAHVDLYSCFPVAVELAADALGLGLDRQLTLTGGLTFGGGPGNSYSLHGIAQVVDACRAAPGSVGLSTALGWYATKHAAGLYSTTPPEGRFQRRPVQAEVDALPTRTVVGEVDVPVTVEAATVVYDREGAPERTIAFALSPSGARTIATSTDAGVAERVAAGGLLGDQVRVAGGQLRA
jgi:acetyl-CoA C-acetyltransferase